MMTQKYHAGLLVPTASHPVDLSLISLARKALSFYSEFKKNMPEISDRFIIKL
jgi:hypothetical protein